MRKRSSVPGCSALRRRYCSSIGVVSTRSGAASSGSGVVSTLARNDLVGEPALPAEPLAQRARLVAGGEGARAHAEDGRRLASGPDRDVGGAALTQLAREGVGQVAL